MWLINKIENTDFAITLLAKYVGLVIQFITLIIVSKAGYVSGTVLTLILLGIFVGVGEWMNRSGFKYNFIKNRSQGIIKEINDLSKMQ